MDEAIAAFDPGIGPHKAGLAENHILQQSRNEIAPPGPTKRWWPLVREAEGTGHCGHEPIHRSALLRCAGEIRPPQERTILEPVRREYIAQEFMQNRLQERKLHGKPEQARTSLGIALLADPFQEALVEPLDQRIELGIEAGESGRGIRFAFIE